MYRAAWYAREKGNGGDAAVMAIKAMKTRKTLFGQEDGETLDSMLMVGSVYKDQGR